MYSSFVYSDTHMYRQTGGEVGSPSSGTRLFPEQSKKSREGGLKHLTMTRDMRGLFHGTIITSRPHICFEKKGKNEQQATPRRRTKKSRAGKTTATEPP